ncbi:putative laminin subunit [Trypoxylus dichotomus]
MLICSIQQVHARRIVGGESTTVEEFPYMTHLQIHLKSGMKALCGGVYIHEYWIITSAHCLLHYRQAKAQPINVRIYAGLTSVANKSSTSVQQKVAILFTTHPKYRKMGNMQRRSGYDLGLLKIRQPFNQTGNVQVGILPTEDRDYSGAEVIALGWGRLDPDKKKYPNDLQMLNTTVWIDNKTKCRSVPTEPICIGRRGQHGSYGDSGGPLLHEGVIIGILSHGRNTPHGAVSVYENVFRQMKWINYVTKRGGKRTASGSLKHPRPQKILLLAAFAKCIPEFENAAFNLQMEASNTCGDNGPIEYCVQSGYSSNKSCDVCYPNQHHAAYLTDFHSGENQTWWQSDTMLEGIHWNQVNLTLHLGKAFDITYVRIWFYSPRPESFAIYKRTSEDSPWIPYQFYSGTCRDTYGLPDSLRGSRGEETRAFCTSEYSDISPLKNGNVAFSTLEGRPSAYNFDSSSELQEWVTATDIKITLERLNTFGDELFGDANVLRSYFYAISDVAVGARCKCNGHASECINSHARDGTVTRVCKCEHNTAGPDCNECLPFYNDAPWGRASERNVHECKPCNCNGFSNRCYFDKDLYERTGHGGHCLDCTANRDGPNCERCRENYYQREDKYCVACNCDPVGSRSLQCNTEGRCQCKPGVTGDKCDRCDINHYDFGAHGCKNCGCLESGSRNNTPDCDPFSGVCSCKDHVEGKRCRECKPGYFNLDFENEFGCTPCFCYGHSSECSHAPGYSKYQIDSNFGKSSERWTAVDERGRSIPIQFNAMTNSIGVSSPGNEFVYFLAPERYLGDQRASYNQILRFTLRIGENNPRATAMDLELVGSGHYVRNSIFAQRNSLPNIQNQQYQFRLHEHTDYGWQPRLSARAFQSILTNLTAIKIRGTYTPEGVGFLTNVRLETASRGVAGTPANWVEQCECPQGYVGQFCESCAPGYRHHPSLGGSFMPCIPCDCNKHTDICDPETGRCICQHNTAGENCELCARGYYGNALAGTPNDCQPCNCPNGGACIQWDDDEIMCIECPIGYTGHKCDLCSDGFFGDPTGRYGPATPCQPCECNLNIDTNAIGNCNTTTGECLKCIHNTGGSKCERCLPGFFGDALKLPKGDCEQCECYPPATEQSEDGIPVCDQITGTCSCKPHVQGRNCDRCELGYYNIVSGEGCHPCNCNPVGSINATCDLSTGQCNCKPGITGLRCDECEPFKYGFSSEGCKSCDCDPIGSERLQCGPDGQCPCLENVEGRRCDRCKENKYDRQRGCINCPDCYNLVQEQAHAHLSKLEHLRKILDEIERNPTVNSNSSFEESLKRLQTDVKEHYELAKEATGGDVTEKLDKIRERQDAISRTLSEIEENIELARDKALDAQDNVTKSEDILRAAENQLAAGLDMLESDGKAALESAQQKAKEFGQQSERMTAISQEARTIADNLDSNATVIAGRAKFAEDEAKQAYELAKNITAQEKNSSNVIENLKANVAETELKLRLVNEAVKDAHDRSAEAKERALELFAEVSDLDVPDVDVAKLKKEAEETRAASVKLIADTDDLINANNEILKEIQEQVLTAKQLLDDAYNQEDYLGQIMNEILATKAQAENAVELGDNTLTQAKNTYEKLSQFDKQVKESEASANEALKKIPEIRQLINETDFQTMDTQGSLDSALQLAEEALQTADAANSMAKEAGEKIGGIKVEAELLHKNASNLKNEADLMGDRVENTRADFNKLQEQSDRNASLLNEAKEKVGRARIDAENAGKKVSDILTDVQGIMTELENLQDFDEDKLKDLEEELEIAEKKVREARLTEMLEKIQEERKQQNALVDSYKEELAYLRKEVENIEQIAAALPEGCFKSIALEP